MGPWRSYCNGFGGSCSSLRQLGSVRARSQPGPDRQRDFLDAPMQRRDFLGSWLRPTARFRAAAPIEDGLASAGLWCWPGEVANRETTMSRWDLNPGRGACEADVAEMWCNIAIGRKHSCSQMQLKNEACLSPQLHLQLPDTERHEEFYDSFVRIPLASRPWARSTSRFPPPDAPVGDEISSNAGPGRRPDFLESVGPQPHARLTRRCP